ncbi:MAG: hypothetical protein ACC683_10975 [Acidimicrobiia bacterium]
MTTTTETVAEPLIAAKSRTTPSRRSHPAARSRTVTLALSITATAGLMIAMGSGEALSSVTVGSEVLPAPPEPTVATVTGPNILLPVPASDGALATAQTATVSAAKPQPILLQPQRRVVVKSNGSR